MAGTEQAYPRQQKKGPALRALLEVFYEAGSRTIN